MSHVMVLGANGFIGRHLTERLASAGHKVIAATRCSTRFIHPDVTNMVARFDCRDDFLSVMGSCTTVIHAASDSTPGSSVAQPQLDGNLRPTLALIEALQEYRSVRLLYISSGGTIYGDRSEPATEESPLRPRSYHGAGKAAAEQFINAWAVQYEGIAVALRPANVYGPGQVTRKGFGIIPAAFQATLQDSPLEIWGDGTSIRDYLYVSDLVRLCELAIDRPMPAGMRAFNAASGLALTLSELLDRIESVTGKRLKRNHHRARSADVLRIAVDDSAARAYFDWQPETSLDQGLALAWRWFSSR